MSRKSTTPNPLSPNFYNTTGEHYHDVQYLDLVRNILDTGVEKGDRTGTGTYSLFGQQMRFDLRGNSIPLLTTKKMFTRGIIYEILWYLRGDTNIKFLNDHNVHIWDEWADENGELGPVYGAQWRKCPTYELTDILPDGLRVYKQAEPIDQIAQIIDLLKNNPNDRRMLVSSWNVAQISDMRLPPCHCLFQFWTDGKRELKCQLYQRSCDVGLGVPFNIVQYSILAHMFAHVTGFTATEFVWIGGDVHIYKNHVKQLQEQALRNPLPSPTLELNSAVVNIDEFKFEDFNIVGYQHHPAIYMEVSV